MSLYKFVIIYYSITGIGICLTLTGFIVMNWLAFEASILSEQFSISLTYCFVIALGLVGLMIKLASHNQSSAYS